MAAREVFVVANVPSSVPADQRQSLVAAHPRADAALLLPAMVPLLAPALVPGGRLRWLHSVPAGAEALLTPEVLAAEQVALTASKGPLGPLVAEQALMLMLALARGLPAFARQQAARRWQDPAEGWPVRALFEKTVLILGVGGVGGHLARMCRVGLRMRVLGTARTRRDDPHVERYVAPRALPAALGEADFVVLCLALTAETRGMVDAAALAAMRPTAYLINVARGGVVDEEALVAALQAGQIAGAGLDVTATEPLPADSPLWSLPNVIITPHIGNGRDRAVDQTIAFMRENIRRFAEGEPLLGAVDRRARY